MPFEQATDLSIIVPILNEAEELPGLLETLLAQQEIRFELILCDGGSSDETLNLAQQMAEGCRADVRCIHAPRGRGRQMNAGASLARSEILLFLHADSRFSDPSALGSAVAAFRERYRKIGSLVAARFALRFRRQKSAPSLAYFFYEAKARLDRADCIRGDQGFMLARHFFDELGGFNESLPFLEDVRLALKIGGQTEWMLLPAEISTSARRFESEGLCERQVANAIIVNALVCDWNEFFSTLPWLYRCSNESGRLLLFPLLDGIRTLLSAHDHAWRRNFWRATGKHVAANIWQLFFWLDVRRDFRAGQQQVSSPPRWYKLFSRYLEPLTRSPVAAAITAAAVRLWYRLLLIKSRHMMP